MLTANHAVKVILGSMRLLSTHSTRHTSLSACRGKVNGGASPGSSSPSWLSSDTCHQLESLPGDCITADRSVQACEAACKDADMQFEDCEAERACGLQPTMAATGHQCLDNYCWQALHSDGSLESLHSLHTSTSF